MLGSLGSKPGSICFSSLWMRWHLLAFDFLFFIPFLFFKCFPILSLFLYFLCLFFVNSFFCFSPFFLTKMFTFPYIVLFTLSFSLSILWGSPFFFLSFIVFLVFFAFLEFWLFVCFLGFLVFFAELLSCVSSIFFYLYYVLNSFAS